MVGNGSHFQRRSQHPLPSGSHFFGDHPGLQGRPDQSSGPLERLVQCGLQRHAGLCQRPLHPLNSPAGAGCLLQPAFVYFNQMHCANRQKYIFNALPYWLFSELSYNKDKKNERAKEKTERNETNGWTTDSATGSQFPWKVFETWNASDSLLTFYFSHTCRPVRARKNFSRSVLVMLEKDQTISKRQSFDCGRGK